MAMLTIDAASETTMKKSQPFRHSSNNVRDASFSSYLDDAEETFIQKLAADSTRSLNKSVISPTPFEPVHLVRKKSEDNEIDIFSADKYFNEGVDVAHDVDNRSPSLASRSSSAKFNRNMVLPPRLDSPKQHHTRSATPSIRSESSWNSQNALLQSSHRNQQAQKTEKVNHRRSFLANFGCNCSCGDKNSVDINDPIVENSPRRSPMIRTPQNGPNRASKAVDLVSLADSQSDASWIRGEDIRRIKVNQLKIGVSSPDEHFRFPVFDSKAKTGDHMLEMQSKKVEDDYARKSIEVFGSPIERNGKNSLNMLTWDAIVRPNETSENSLGIYNDADSDASSDLFEIESFATNPSQYLTRQGSDGGMSSAFTQTCYAPSEASIEWSVVTASAADFSVMSDMEETRSSTNSRGYNPGRRSLSDREMIPPKRRTGILSGCYSQKAVNVAGNAYRASEKTSPVRHQKAEFVMPMTRFHAGNDPARFDKRNDYFGYDSHLLYKH